MFPSLVSGSVGGRPVAQVMRRMPPGSVWIGLVAVIFGIALFLEGFVRWALGVRGALRAAPYSVVLRIFWGISLAFQV